MRQHRFLLAIVPCLASIGCSAFVNDASNLRWIDGSRSTYRVRPNDRPVADRRGGRPFALGMWSKDDQLEGADRLKACIPYVLPMIDGDAFGHYIYERVPILGELSEVLLGPLVRVHDAIPFFSVIFFIFLTLGTRFNLDMSRNVRFSAQQAALIDAALVLPEIVREGLQNEPLPRSLAEPCCNLVWYIYVVTVGYCIICNLRGRRPDQVPYISPTADLMVGPY